MPLATHVQNRYSAQLLIELTNPDNADATTLDSTRLGLAAGDVEADFRIYAGTAYSDTDARHIAAAVPGVIQKLRIYMGQVADVFAAEEDWQKRLRALGMVTGRNRIRPTLASNLTDENAQAQPPFRDSNFDDYLPGEPIGRTTLLGDT